ncbi:M23 family metallopeptidase [Aquimarina aquimarini]|uniref:M23 family metallopeptidase n=1 Tax=Aquimarina aquimarini TaxID=1191734 RepID=UPI000D55A002|nr:M23 family metallopeptidase [Aquimarina aquimarini]
MKNIKLFIYVSIIAYTLISCTNSLIGDEGELDEDIYLNYETVTDLELPFEEEWYVFNGGKTHKEGAHHFTTRGGGERYAIDFVIVVDTEISNGILRKIHSGDGKKNEDHYCFGKRLNAPGDGKITEVVNNIDDNQPGTMNRDQPGGNYIIIDHLNGETSILAHLKKGSIMVAVGDTVVKGQEVGKTGNSGSSGAPHLHYQLQGTSGRLGGLGLPAQFLNYYEDDVLVEREEPVRGQKIRKN